MNDSDNDNAMVSPPASHPFIRPAIVTTPSPPDSLHTPGTTTYQSLLAPEEAPSVGRTSPAPASGRGSFVKVNGAKQNGHASYQEPPRKLSRWEEKVQGDLAGWRGGQGTPRSSVPQPGQPNSTYFNQPTTGVIGRDLPKEIIRIQRDWSLGDVAQFSTVFPLELESRLAPETFTKIIERINEPLREAFSTTGAVWDNAIAILTFWTSLLWRTSHFEKELVRAERVIAEANANIFNGIGLNVLSPRPVALQYLEIE